MDKVMYFIKTHWLMLQVLRILQVFYYDLSCSGKTNYTINLFIKYEYQLISDLFPLNKHWPES